MRAGLTSVPELGEVARLPSAPDVPVAPDPLPTTTKKRTVPRTTADAFSRLAATGEEGLGPVYSALESHVTPAELLRSQLPKQPAAGADTGYFDLVVNETGDVQVVRLISPRNRYQDRMLVAAAKAWKFKPALLDGRPVKYRLRMPVIVPEPD
jgi:hypothetical protein